MSNPYDKVTIARRVTRPTAKEYIDIIFNDFFELHGDRYFKDDEAIVGGIAYLENMPVTVIGIQKGHTLEENIKRNFGSPHPEGYRKALRLMKQAEKFSRPVITFINTSGAYCGISAEERGQGEAIAKIILEMSALKVPVVTAMIGEGSSGGALALAVADKICILSNAVYSILSPEGFATILWKDSSRTEEAASIMKITANDLLELNIVDKIIQEPEDGAENDLEGVSKALKLYFRTELELLYKENTETLLSNRYERFRKFGDFTE